MGSQLIESFVAFIEMLKSFDFEVDWKILKACDYGGATSRERLFIRASRLGPIVWPEPTHASPKALSKKSSPQLSLVNPSEDLKPYRVAAEILNLDDPGESIFSRKKPLSINTLARLFRGLEKFCGIRIVDSNGQPLPVATINDLVRLGQPFLLKYYGGHFGESIYKPIPALTANYEHYALVTPVPRFDPIVVEFRKNVDARSIWDQVSTICTSGNHHGIATPIARPVIVPTNHGEGDLRCYGVDRTFPTVTSVDAWAVAQAITKPILIKYNATGGAIDPEVEPLHTISTRDRFGLVNPQVIEDGTLFWLDILFRMLHPYEMAAAMGFKKTYIFMGGSRENDVKLIGNAVSVEMAEALSLSIFKPEMVTRRKAA